MLPANREVFKKKKSHMVCLQLGHRQGQTNSAGCALPWFRTAEPLGKRHYENWIYTLTT